MAYTDEYKPNELWTKWEGVYEVSFISAITNTNFNNGNSAFIRGFICTYFLKEDTKKGYASIQFIADGEVAEQIAESGAQKGDIVHVIGKMSQKKETRYKDDKGNDVFVPTLRVTAYELADKRKTEIKPKYIPPQHKKSQEAPKASADDLVIIEDDLPF